MNFDAIFGEVGRATRPANAAGTVADPAPRVEDRSWK